MVKPIVNHPHFTRWVVQSLQNSGSMISMVLGESNINNINIHGSSHQSKKLDLVGGLEHLNYVFHILVMSSSQLTFIFFRGIGIPPTSSCKVPVLWHSSVDFPVHRKVCHVLQEKVQQLVPWHSRWSDATSCCCMDIQKSCCDIDVNRVKNGV